MERAMGIKLSSDCLEATEYTSFLLSPLEHNRGYFFDRFAVSIPKNVRVDLKSNAGLFVP